tara:strand:+ start:62065 stop:63279 length:1215 start_codon:yes stop_codon:yes gene_type:complete
MMLNNYTSVMAKCNELVTEQFTILEIFKPQLATFASRFAENYILEFKKNPKDAKVFGILSDLNSKEPLSTYLDVNKFEGSHLAKEMIYSEFTDLCLRYFCLFEIEGKQSTIQLHKQIDSSGHSFSLHFNWEGCEVEFNGGAEVEDILHFDSSFLMTKIHHKTNSFSQLLPPSSVSVAIAGVNEAFIEGFGFKQRISMQTRDDLYNSSIEDNITNYQTLSAMKLLINSYLNASFNEDADEFKPMVQLIGRYIAKYQTERCKLIDLEFVNDEHTGTVDNWIDLFTKIEALGSAIYHPDIYQNSDFKPTESDLNTFNKNMFRMVLRKSNDMDNPIALYALTMAVDVKSLDYDKSSSVGSSLAKHDLEINEVRNSIELASKIDEVVEEFSFNFNEDVVTMDSNLDYSL